MKKRNGTISLLKFLFSIVIVLYHCRNMLANGYDGIIKMSPGYLGVEFFFIISGFYFGKKIIKEWNKRSNVYIDNLKNIWGKLKRFLPYSIVATIIVGIIMKIYHKVSFINLVSSIYSATMLGMFGISKYQVDGPLWYISAMLICMFILYPIIRKYKKSYIYYACPLIILFGLGYIFQEYHGLTLIHADWNGLFYGGLLRGMVEINIGILIAASMDNINKLIDKIKIKHMNGYITMLEIFMYVTLFAFIVFYSQWRKCDFIVLVFIAIACIVSLSERSYTIKIFSHPFYYYLEQLSLPIFINHYIFMRLFMYNGFGNNHHFFVNASMCLGLTMIFSMIELQLINYFKKKFSKS